MVNKWNFERREYEESNNEYAARIFFGIHGLQEEVRCANCGKRMPRGECMVSKQYHDDIGMGYPVCVECHAAEWEKWEKWEKWGAVAAVRKGGD